MKLLIGLLAAVLCCGGTAVGLAAYRTNLAGLKPAAQVSSTATPTTKDSASTPAPTPTATPTALAPPTTQSGKGGPLGMGTYWICVADVSGSSIVEHSLDASIEAEGGVLSPQCERAWKIGEMEGDLKLEPGENIFRIPVGHFTPFSFCGVTIANILDTNPADYNKPPTLWVAANYEQYSLDWSTGAPSGTC